MTKALPSSRGCKEDGLRGATWRPDGDPRSHFPYLITGVSASLLILLASLSFPLQAQTTTYGDSSLILIRDLYEQGSYLSSEIEARRFLESRPISDSLKILAEQYLAFSLVAQGKNTLAIDHFVAILRIDSAFALHPTLTSPKILAVFDQAKQQFRSLKRSEPTTSPVGPLSQVRSPSFRTVLFPGWEQIHQGRDTKGYVLLAAGIVSLGSTLYLDIERRRTEDEYHAADTPELAATRYDRYNRYYRAEYYSLAAFLVVYLYSQFDAFFDLPPSSSAVTLQSGSNLQLTLRVTF